MTTATSFRKYDSWELRTLREAAEYNRANPDPAHQGAIDWVEARLAEAEGQDRVATATPVADEEPFQGDPGSRTGFTNYGGQAATGASEAQERFIRSLCAERGLDADAILAAIKDRRAASKKIDELKAIKPQATVRPATERQMQFLQDLLAERVHEFDADQVATWNFTQASEAISRLLAAPKVKTGAHGIRHGRYAFAPADGSPAQFYRVGQNGRIYIQAGPAEHPYRGKLNAALEAIKADPQAHAALYGQLIGSCGRCGLPLTDKTSRSLGLGPICANKTDW